MKTELGYYVVRAETLDDFEQKVNEALDGGYALYGPPQFTETGDCWRAHQAMVDPALLQQAITPTAEAIGPIAASHEV